MLTGEGRRWKNYWFNPTFLGLASHQWPRPEGLEAIGESQAQKSGIKAVYSPKLQRSTAQSPRIDFRPFELKCLEKKLPF